MAPHAFTRRLIGVGDKYVLFVKTDYGWRVDLDPPHVIELVRTRVPRLGSAFRAVASAAPDKPVIGCTMAEACAEALLVHEAATATLKLAAD